MIVVTSKPRYRPVTLGVQVCAIDDPCLRPVTVRNFPMPSLEIAWQRFCAARLICRQASDDHEPELVVDLVNRNIIGTFPMRRHALGRLSDIIEPPPNPFGYEEARELEEAWWRGFYMVEKWDKQEVKPIKLIHGSNNLFKARDAFDEVTKHRPRGRYLLRHRARVLRRWPRDPDRPE